MTALTHAVRGGRGGGFRARMLLVGAWGRPATRRSLLPTPACVVQGGMVSPFVPGNGPAAGDEAGQGRPHVASRGMLSAARNGRW